MRNVFDWTGCLKMNHRFGRVILAFALSCFALSPASALNLFSEHGIRIEHRVDENMVGDIRGILTPMNFGSSQGGQRVDGSAKHETNVRGVLSPIDWGRGEFDRTEMLTDAKQNMFTSVARGAIGRELLQQMRVSKIANATYIYQQDVYPASKRYSGIFKIFRSFGYEQALPGADATKMTLTWSVSARLQDGYIFSTEPVIEDPDQSIVYARYFAFNPDPALGNSTRFQNAGILEFQLRALDGTPLTDFVRFQTNGEYDPSRESDGAGDVRFGVNCITKNTSVCPRGGSFGSVGFRYPDLQSQMLATGALSAILDYHHPVAPQTNDEGKEKVSVTMTIRNLTQTGCSRGIYRNAGVIERVLVEEVSRFATYPADVGPHLLSGSERETVSTSTYDKTIQIPPNIPYLQNYGIHPFPELIIDGPGGETAAGVKLPHDTLLTLPELREMGVSTIPSIRKTNSMTPEQNFGLHSSSAGMSVTRVSAGQTQSINFASGSDVWPLSDATYDRELSFSIYNKNFFSSVTLDDLIYDDHTLVYINGQQIFGGSYPGTTQLQIFRRIENLGYDDCRPVGTNLYDCGTVSSLTQEFTPQARISAMWCSGSTCQLFDVNTGKVEYSPGAFGEHSRGGDQNGGSFDLTQYIRDGVNTIQTKTLSGGGGNLSFRLNSTSCIEPN